MCAHNISGQNVPQGLCNETMADGTPASDAARRGGERGAPDEKDPAARLRPGPKTTFFSLGATRYARGGIVGWMRSR